MARFTVLIAIFAAVFLYAINILAEPIGVYDDPSRLTCNKSDSHCVYLKNAFTYGDKDGKPIRCSKRDKHGYGIDVCQFPDNTTTTIQCRYDNLTTLYVKFSKSLSKFVLHGYASAIWSSEKAGTNYTSGASNTTYPGDDLYVACGGKGNQTFITQGNDTATAS